MTALKQITPLVSVRNVAKSIDFFEQTLGFKCLFKAEGYAYLHRDGVGIRIQHSNGPFHEQVCYIDVEDIDELYDELKPELEQLPVGQFRPIVNQDYGQREFHVKDLDSLLIFFGEAIQGE